MIEFYVVVLDGPVMPGLMVPDRALALMRLDGKDGGSELRSSFLVQCTRFGRLKKEKSFIEVWQRINY